MKIHVKPSKLTVIGHIVAIVFLLAIEVWPVLYIYFSSGRTSLLTGDMPYLILVFFLCDIAVFFLTCCAIRSYTFDTNGIYVKWHIVNKVQFHPWSDFIDNYHTLFVPIRSYYKREYYNAVVFSKKKRQMRAQAKSVIMDGLYPFSTIGVTIYDDADYSPKNHPSGVCKSQFMELLQQANVSVEWNT